MKNRLRNADQPSIAEVMSDPAYLAETYRVRKQLELDQAVVKAVMGIKDPTRFAEVDENVGFAEGLVSADEGESPVVPVGTNKRFRRR